MLASVLAARGGRLLEADAKVVGRRILLGLQSMHAGGFAHLDIKPDNIGVEKKGDLDSVVLMDFDCSQPLGAAPTQKRSSKPKFCLQDPHPAKPP